MNSAVSWLKGGKFFFLSASIHLGVAASVSSLLTLTAREPGYGVTASTSSLEISVPSSIESPENPMTTAQSTAPDSAKSDESSPIADLPIDETSPDGFSISDLPKPSTEKKRFTPSASLHPAAQNIEMSPRSVRSAGSTGSTEQGATRPSFSYLHNPSPVYPESARKAGMEGVVHLDVAVTAQGEVDSITIRQSSGYPLLDKSAVDRVSTWRFRPAEMGGYPIASHIVVPIRFRLKDL